MKLIQTTIINGNRCTKDRTVEGIDIYTDAESETLYMCKDGAAFLEVKVDAYTGEGGGGCLDLTEI